MGISQIEVLVAQLVMGTNMELYGTTNIDEEEYYGIELDLFDYLDKVTDFESDVEGLMQDLEEILDANIFISDPRYTDIFSICDLDGKEYPNYHAFIQIVKLK